MSLSYKFIFPNAANYPKIPLRGLLIVPFVLQIFADEGLTGYFSLQNGQKAVNDVAAQLRCEITTRIEQNLHTYLATPVYFSTITNPLKQIKVMI